MELESVLAKVSTYAAAEHLDELRQTLYRAENVFRGNQPPSDVTLAHPLGVANILAEWRMALPLIRIGAWSAALHQGGLDDLNTIFDESHARIAAQIVKFNSLLIESRQQRHMRPLRPALLGELWSPEMVIMLTALFLDAIRRGATSANSPDKQILAIQARVVFVPIVSQRLGMWQVRRELLDLAFQCENPAGYARAQEFIGSFQPLEPFIERVKELVWDTANSHGITNLELVHEIAHPYKVAELRRRKRRLDASDLVSFIALLPDTKACYGFVPVLHSVGNPHHSFRDYLSHPKRNGYRSLHSRICIPSLGQVRFFIRTQKLHEESNFGVLCRWWRGEAPAIAIDNLMPQPPEGHILVYTDDGKPYLLPEGATVLDLAYKIGKITGHRFSNAQVYGRQGFVEAEYRLEDGDIVKINTGKRYGPRETWLQIVKTRAAKIAIRSWLDKAESGAHLTTAVVSPESAIDIAAAVDIPPGLPNRSLQLCNRCRPYPPQEIMAHCTAEGLLTLHRIDCPVVRDIANTVPVRWRRSALQPASVVLDIEAWDRIGLLEDIAREISVRKVNMAGVNAEVRTNSTAHFMISLQERDQAIIEEICQAILQVPFVVTVNHTSPTLTTVPEPGPSESRYKFRNPYSPLPATGVFFGRANERQRIWRALEGWERFNSVLLWGQQRIGKTSLLMRLEDDAQGEPTSQYVPVRVTMIGWEPQPGGAPGNLPLWFAQQIEKGLAKVAQKRGLHLPCLDHRRMQEHPVEAFEEYIDQLQNTLAPSHLLVMLDEFQRLCHIPGSQGELLLSSLEHLLETLKEVSFIFAGWGLFSSDERYRPLRPVLALTVPLRLGVLDPEAAEELIRRPVYPRFTYEEDVIKGMLELTNCHPYYIHLLCRDMVDSAMGQPNKRVLTCSDFNEAVERLLRGSLGPFIHLLQAVPDGENVLVDLARLASPDGWVAIQPLIQRLAPQFDEGRVRRILQDLTELEVLERKEDLYRIQVPLLQRWIESNLLH